MGVANGISRNKKVLLSLLIPILVLGAGAVYFLVIKPKKPVSETTKMLTEAARRQDAMRYSDAEQQKLFDQDKELALLRKDIYEGDAKVALQKLNDLISKNPQGSSLFDTLLTYKIDACAKLVDENCMKETIDLIKANTDRYTAVLIRYGDGLYQQGKKIEAKAYYKSAIESIDKAGGTSYLKSISTIEVTYDYAQIKVRSQ